MSNANPPIFALIMGAGGYRNADFLRAGGIYERVISGGLDAHAYLVLLKSLIDDIAYCPVDAYNLPMSSERGSP
ncbi:MAG: hypothetical protein GXP09_12010 [Gammaproteobacteria bacterium]|nr:hypothetical protein [Gammaproteobacteria bacterium]